VGEALKVRYTRYFCWAPGFGLPTAGMVSSRNSWSLSSAKIVVEEIGSTLFATIDKLEKSCRSSGLSIPARSICYRGVEVSDLFARVSQLLHPQAQMTLFSDWKQLPPTERATTFARSYQATSYAFDDTPELAAWMTRASSGLHGVWLSLGNKDEEIKAHGKKALFFSIEQLCPLLNSAGFAVFPVSTERFVFAEKEFISAFVFVTDMNAAQLRRFFELCDKNADFGVAGLRGAERKDAAGWIKNAPAFRGTHAGFLTHDKRQTERPFDFTSEIVDRAFSAYLARLK